MQQTPGADGQRTESGWRVVTTLEGVPSGLLGLFEPASADRGPIHAKSSPRDPRPQHDFHTDSERG